MHWVAQSQCLGFAISIYFNMLRLHLIKECERCLIGSGARRSGWRYRTATRTSAEVGWISSRWRDWFTDFTLPNDQNWPCSVCIARPFKSVCARQHVVTWEWNGWSIRWCHTSGCWAELKCYYFFIFFHLAKTLAKGNWRCWSMVIFRKTHPAAWCTWQLFLHGRESGSRLRWMFCQTVASCRHVCSCAKARSVPPWIVWAKHCVCSLSKYWNAVPRGVSVSAAEEDFE